MNILQVLALLQLLAVPAFSLAHDYWEEFGPYGTCSRTCGTGVAMRTRKCRTTRTDGGHNCIGSSKSYRICNTHECPAGSRDFREEQCSQFDRMDFQSKRHTWIPYYGASNPCELNCIPKGESVMYRHRPAVVDGTRCYAGRTDICVDGVCRVLARSEFMGLEDQKRPTHSAAPVAPHPMEMLMYVYKAGVYGACSATCNGGMQYRKVDCLVQDPMNPHVVDESYCIAQRLHRPQSQQACNMHPCATDAKYSVSSYGACSVTCGEGQRTREVVCVGARGERLSDEDCAGVARPASSQVCRKPACSMHIKWHVTDYGLCTQSCSGGVRERRVGCFDSDMNPYPESRCGTASRPVTVEACNTQPCPGTQMVPSVQDPRAHESTMRGFMPYVPGVPSASRQHPNAVSDPDPEMVSSHCVQSYYGCCPDGHTPATGPRNEGCSQQDCVHTRYGCCLDGVTAAGGFGRAGCPEQQMTVHSPRGAACTLPRDPGPCDTWKPRFYYDSGSGKCTRFWYGSCEGNGNNFVSLEMCQRECEGAVREAPRAPRRSFLRRLPYRGVHVKA